MAGLVTAKVLSPHFDRVTILERDRLPEQASTRRGVPQGRHAHVLLAAGQRLLEGWFPGLSEELVGLGAVAVATSDTVWHQAGDYRVMPELGFPTLSMSRPLLERTVLSRLLLQEPNVHVSDEVSVDGVIVEDGRVTGLRVNGVANRSHLVVDCSGRNTRFLDQLAKVGFPLPEITAIRIDMAYGTRVIARRPGDLDRSLALIVDDPTRCHRLGTMVPVEGDRSIVTLAGFHGDVPPTDPDRYGDFARSLPSPLLADALAGTDEATAVMTHRMPTSQRRHVERLRRTPPGFLVLGDAICSFNPVYGQGMSSAALQAQALSRTIERLGPTSPSLAPAFYQQAAKAVDVPWKMAAGADFADPRTGGRKPVGTDLVNRYLELVFEACHTSPEVSGQLLRVQNLLAPSTSMMTPAMVLRVLLAARRSPTRRRRSDDHPRSDDPRHIDAYRDRTLPVHPVSKVFVA
jgi:2-polyprenyl-6-methoxyphenol hydroxylase-like FAD-dependent oxidoreductase